MGNFETKMAESVDVVDWSYSGYLFKTGLPVFVDHKIRSEFFKPGVPVKMKIIQEKIFGVACSQKINVTYDKKEEEKNFKCVEKEGMYWVG